MKQNELVLNTISADEYHEFSYFLREHCGIDLGANKEYLVAARVRRILAEQKIQSITDLVALVRADKQNRLRQSVIDVMTTNETQWFRDQYPFQYLTSTLQSLAKKQSRIRIWSAACSTGQEAYSMAMIVDELKRQGDLPRTLNVEITGSDISTQVLELANLGVYDAMALQRGLSVERIHQHFDQLSADAWQIKPELRNIITFKTFNLQQSFTELGQFDIVFCRNVLIYFSLNLKQEILQKIHASLPQEGLLILGSSEGLVGLSALYDMINCNPGVAYRKK